MDFLMAEFRKSLYMMSITLGFDVLNGTSDISFADLLCQTENHKKTTCPPPAPGTEKPGACQ